MNVFEVYDAVAVLCAEFGGGYLAQLVVIAYGNLCTQVEMLVSGHHHEWCTRFHVVAVFHQTLFHIAGDGRSDGDALW